MHDDGRGSRRIKRPRRTKLFDFDDEVARGDGFGRQPRALLAEQQHARLGQRGFVNRHRTRDVVDTDDRQFVGPRPFEKFVDRGVVNHMLVTIGDHRPALVPAPAADDVDRIREERVRGANNRPDVEVVLPVLDRDVKSMTLGIKVSDNRFHRPIAVFVDDIAGVAIFEERWVEVGGGRPLSTPRANAVRGKFGCRRIAFVFCHSVNLGE
ncbi:MAG: hypothetical protein RL294_263 [Actinomycetota bacterium]